MTFLDQDNRNSGSGHPASRTGDLEWEDEAEFVTARPSGLRALRAIVAVVILVGIGYVIYSGARAWFTAQLDPEGPPAEDVVIDVPAGATVGDLASQLQSEGIIPNSTFFRFYADYQGFSDFQAGEYTMQANMSADEAMARINDGPKQIEYGEFLIPEGLWLSEVLDRVAQQIPGITAAQLQAVLDSDQIEPRYRPAGNDSWEGLLFPAKYFIEEDIEPVEVLALMSNEFAAVTGELGYGAAERTHNLSAYEVIIIASLIEAEAKIDEDRPKISRVIHNRIIENQPLGIDATIIFGKGIRGEPIFQSDLDTPGPYNTRHPTSRGLPPTPIAVPGRKSLEAAMNPTPDEGWLYYVLINEEGGHAFADDLEAHNDNVAIARDLGLLDS